MADLDRWVELLAATAAEQRTQPARICTLCVDLLEVSGAGISMVTPAGNRGVVCATDDRAAQIEDLQQTTGLGPCYDAVNSGAPVLLPDLAHPDGTSLAGWLGFSDTIRRDGVAAVFAFPLQIGAITLGALDLYRDSPGNLSLPQLSAAQLAADAAAVALLQLRTDREDAFDADPRTRADYRLQIHQATGMVKEQLDVTLEEALLRLRARAFAAEKSLAEISAEVVARRLRFTPEDS